jgi:hypothetical protein
MKLAKLEVKMIVALFVVGYDYGVVDSKGGIFEKLPVPNYNDLLQVRTSSNPICLIAQFILMTITRLGPRTNHASSSSNVL